MKPQALCFVNMGEKGLDVVKVHPDVIPQEELTEIAVKSMPLGAKDGDFTTNTVRNNVLSGYIFSIPRENERDNIGSLVAIFKSMKYQPQIINKIFSFTIAELKKHNMVSKESITGILPSLYNGMIKGQLKIKVSSVVTIEMSFGEKEKRNKKDKLGELGDDIW
ncbi:MAG: hypothetical protein K9W42_06275 [Candidatus Heimdallarchaeota archaeon]|nr:hypothetical protein [Candidatus Heimdallarchaeota archaeon]